LSKEDLLSVPTVFCGVLGDLVSSLTGVEADSLTGVEVDSLIGVEVDSLIGVETDSLTGLEADSLTGVESGSFSDVEVNIAGSDWSFSRRIFFCRGSFKLKHRIY
jgi:hypothetical protein